jgi:hypothetical protein
MNERRSHHVSPIERIIRSGGGQPTYGTDATRDRDMREYVPFTIDAMPRMGFTIYHYSRKGQLTRHDIMFHEMKHRVTRTHEMYVMYSFDADGVVFLLRGRQSMYELADAILDCKLHTVYVYDPEVWTDVDPGVELIDRSAIRSVRSDDMSLYDSIEDDDSEADIPGEHPLKPM